MTALINLKAATELRDVAELLGFKPSGLAYIVYKLDAAAKYTKFEIPKRYGGTRQISAPSDKLKLLQQRLADLLQNCVEDINKNAGYEDRISHGFKRDRSILSNARVHRNRRYVFNVDLENFFGSINYGRVRGFFIKDKGFALHKDVATVLAQIACFENALPQGSPCSPVISNLIGHILDIHLVRLASKAGCSYTRYADDLTFSTNQREFPPHIAFRDDAKPHTWLPGKALVHLVKKSDFKINPGKMRMQYRDSRQEVTGLVVNRKLNVRREYRHTVRAMVHRLLTKGGFDFVQKVKDGKGGLTTTSNPGEPRQLHGMLGFIDGVDLYNRRAANEQVPPAQRDKKSVLPSEAIYKRFLLFTEFYAAPSPVIICEGKTDNVYLVHAIRWLAADYPELAATAKDGAVKVNVRLFKYTGSSTSRILGISGGAHQLKHLITEYWKHSMRFTAPGKKHPVMVLIDNDDAGKDIFNFLSAKLKTKVDGKMPFVHVIGNLYVVPTPIQAGGAKSQIEDFFDDATKKTVIDGKKFDPDADENDVSHYGKTVFAHKVVAAQKDTIDFGGFKPLLNNFVALIKEHAKKFPP